MRTGVEKITGTEVELWTVDCGDAEAMAPVFHAPFAGAIHFAADKSVGDSTRDPERYFDNNIGGTARLLAQLRAHGVSNVVFSSSCTVYGEAECSPVDETAPILPAASPYGYTKQACACSTTAMRLRKATWAWPCCATSIRLGPIRPPTLANCPSAPRPTSFRT